jgi:hypothetical protein
MARAPLFALGLFSQIKKTARPGLRAFQVKECQQLQSKHLNLCKLLPT